MIADRQRSRELLDQIITSAQGSLDHKTPPTPSDNT